MTHKIRFIPSNHTFTLDGKETLLEAALQSGYSPNYGCHSGNCGECKVKLLNGSIDKTKHHDYALLEQEKLNGEFLLCAYTAQSDLEIEVNEAIDAEDLPIQSIRVKLKNLKAIDDNISVLSLQTPRTHTLRFLAGQYINLSCDDNNEVSIKIYIASCPCDDRNLQLHLRNDKEIQGKKLTECLSDMLHIQIEGPFGESNAYEPDTQTAFFICHEHGFGPVKSLIEHTLSIDDQALMYLFRFANSNETQYLHNQCRAWTDAFDNFIYQANSMESYQEIVQQIIVAAKDKKEPIFYLAGNEHFLKQVKKDLNAEQKNWVINSILVK